MHTISGIYYIYKGNVTPIWKSMVKIGENIVTMDASWNCRMLVKKSFDTAEVPIIDKTIAYDPSTNTFPCFLTPSETDMLEPGEYYVFIEISNLSFSPPIKKESNLLLKVEQQGVI